MTFLKLTAAVPLVLAAGLAHATTYEFIGPPGFGEDLNTTEVFMDTTNSFSVEVTAINTEQPPVPLLHWDDHGLGVNSECGLLQDGLENIGDDEAIVFDFGTVVDLEEISLTRAGSPDEYRIYGTNDGSVENCTMGGLTCLTSVSTLIASGNGTGLIGGADVDLTGNSYQYLIATTPTGSGDRYRIDSVSVAPVPLPAAGLLMVAGLGGLAALRRRKK